MSYEHKNRKVLLLFKQLERRGFVIHHRKKGFKIVPPRSMSGPPYFTHGTTACFFPLQRFLRDTFGLVIE